MRFEARRPFAEADQRMRAARLADPTVDGHARGGERHDERKRQHHAPPAVLSAQRQARDHHRGLRGERRDTLIEPPEFIDVKTRGRAERHDAETNFVADRDDLAASVGERGLERFDAGLSLSGRQRVAVGGT